MRNTFGSHWRWRLLLLLTCGLLAAGTRSQAPRWDVDFVPGVSSRIVVVARVGTTWTVKVLDEATGQFHNVNQFENNSVPSLRVVRGGAALSWHQGNILFAADLDAPYSQRFWTFPVKNEMGEVVGLSSDERFAILESPYMVDIPNSNGARERRWLLEVVDLARGEVVSSQESRTPTAATHTADEFRFAPVRASSSTDVDGIAATLWKLTPQGAWEAIEAEPLPSFTRYNKLPLARSPSGTFRILAKDEQANPSEMPVTGYVVGMSPAGHLIVEPIGVLTDLLIGRMNDEEMRQSDCTEGFSAFSFSRGFAFTRDDVAAIVDVWGDVKLFDLTTGTTIKTLALGTTRKRVLDAIAVGSLLLAALWAWIGARERSLWWQIDVAGAAVCLPFAALVSMVGNHHPWLTLGAVGPRFGHLAFMVGAVMGAAVITGWFWTYGRGRAPVKWITGGLWLCLMCVCLSRSVMSDQLQIDDGELWEIDVVWSLCLAGSLMAAGLVAIGLLMFKANGWLAGDATLDEPSHQFTLTSMLVGIVGISALVALGSAAPIDLYFRSVRWILIPVSVTLLALNLIASLVLCRSVWLWLVQAFLVILLLPIIWSITNRSLGMMAAWPPGTSAWILYGFLPGAILPVIIGSGLARCHGWRWFRAAQKSSAEETAREIMLDAPHGAVV